MSSSGDTILEHLRSVEKHRMQRAQDAALAERVLALKAYQQARFRRSYADLLADKRHAEAARFFLEELYGPEDFSQRDAQFVRIVPALVRLFPGEIVDTVEQLAALHALSEELDSSMAQRLTGLPVEAEGYRQAWQATGLPEARERQIALMLAVGRALEAYTRNPLLRHSLRLMRGPAKAAGLAALQAFLEAGFETFRALRGADEFLATIALRERTLAERLFVASSAEPTGPDDPIGQLP